MYIYVHTVVLHPDIKKAAIDMRCTAQILVMQCFGGKYVCCVVIPTLCLYVILKQQHVQVIN